MADENDVTEVTDDAVVTSDDGPQDAPQLTEIEEVAADMGWTPKDQWKGDPDAWKPAKDYVRATRDVNKSLKSDLKQLQRQVEGISRATASMTERAIAEARSEWESKLEQAVEDGDKQGVKAAQAELTKLERATPQPDMPPEAQDFAERHSSWFGKDREATEYAAKRADYYAAQGLSPARQLKAVEKDMRDLFPELFDGEPAEQRKAPKPPASVGEPQRTVRTQTREKGYATLPPEARKACDAWVASNQHRGSFVSKEAWAKSYYEQEAANG